MSNMEDITHSPPSADKPGPAPAPALIVFGRDDSGKAHASWFDEADAPLADKAAGMMGMAALRATTEALRGLAGQLPQGRVFSSGKAFVPFVKGALFDTLAANLPPDFVWPERPPVEPNSKVAKKAKVTADASPGAAPPVGKAKPPIDWSQIDVGSVVLATEGDGEGWFEAQVVKVNADGLYTLRWRDWPDNPVCIRRRVHVALIHPKHTD